MDASFKIPGLGQLQPIKALPTSNAGAEQFELISDCRVNVDSEVCQGGRASLGEDDDVHVGQVEDTVMIATDTRTKDLIPPRLPIGSSAPNLQTNALPEATQSDHAQAEERSTPGSPLVTDALEAALQGLLATASEHEEELDNRSVVKPDPDKIVEQSTSAPGECGADTKPEWEVDSSSYGSSSSDSSDDSSDDENGSDVGDSSFLGVEETARLLMEADGESDCKMDGTRAAKQAATVRTKNELLDVPEPKPEITISAEDTIAPLGVVQHTVEGTQTVIEAFRDGNAAVTILDRGTVLCKEDRTVLGVIHDTIATIHRPMYILKFRTEEEAKEAALERGTSISYCKSHAKFVFPAQLRLNKGSDASNLHDEEVGPDEVEYSDDEQEQAHKREKKNRKRGPKGKINQGDDNDLQATCATTDSNLNYDDHDVRDVDEGPYKKLSRPANFGMGLPPPPPPPAPAPPAVSSTFPIANGNGHTGANHGGRRGDFRGRGGRARGFNGRGRGGGPGHNARPSQAPQAPQAQPFAANPSRPAGHWPLPVPALLPLFGEGAASPTTPTGQGPSYPMPNWGAAQTSPFPCPPPVPPPNWFDSAQSRLPQHVNYMLPAGGYSLPAQYSPGNGSAGPGPGPGPDPSYASPNYYGGQSQSNQQQRWG